MLYVRQFVVRCSYYVRVVSTQPKTTVMWDTADGKTTGYKVLARAEFTQIYNPLASQPMRIICDKPCLVMQYNPGLSLLMKLQYANNDNNNTNNATATLLLKSDRSLVITDDADF